MSNTNGKSHGQVNGRSLEVPAKPKRSTAEVAALIATAEAKCKNVTYCNRVNLHVGAAERTANDAVGGVCPQGMDSVEWASRWNAVYHRTMDEMCTRAGLRRMSWQGREK